MSNDREDLEFITYLKKINQSKVFKNVMLVLIWKLDS